MGLFLRILILLSIIFSAIDLLLVIPLYVIFRITFHSPFKGQNNEYNLPSGKQYAQVKDKMFELIDELKKVPYEDVYITSFDGLKLHGRYYHQQDGAPLSIGFHGYRGTALRDMCGSFNLTYNILHHNVLLIDQRAHGESEGNALTFGIKERFDCKSWVEYAVKRFGDNVEIYLNGASMGATTILMASGLELPSNVKAIIAESPYSSPKAIICKVCKDLKFWPKIVYPLIALSAIIFSSLIVDQTSAEEAVKNSNIPTLIIHGEADKFVPCEMSEIIGANNPKVKRITFANTGHALGYLMDSERYLKEVLTFLDSTKNDSSINEN